MNTSECFFRFENKRVLIEKPENMPSPGPYYPCLVSMKDLKGFPFEWALYFSTDHHSGNGGIWLYLCNGIPSNPDNWISYDQAVINGTFDHLESKPQTNPIYTDTIQGKHHTETCHVNIIDDQVYMTYHHCCEHGLQPTLLAISADGVNFNRYRGNDNSIILDTDENVNGTGYFRWGTNPFHRVAYKFAGYSLHGGGDYYHSALWGSNDAVHWDKVHVFTPIEGLAMQDKDLIMIWHEINPNVVERIGEDEYVLLSCGGNRASGAVSCVVKLFEIFLAGDGKTLTRETRQILPLGEESEPDCEEAAAPTLAKIDDTYHLIYVGTSDHAKRNTVMSAVGTFNPDAKPPERIG